MNILNGYLNQKYFASVVLFVLAINLIVGCVLLPYRNAQAYIVYDPTNMAENVLNYILDQMKWAWDRVQAAITHAYEAIMQAWAIWDRADTYLMRALKWAWTVLKRTLLDMLVNDIVNWINGGGEPKLVTDWQGFLKDAADQAGGQFVDRYLGMGFLCDRFDLSIRMALAGTRTFVDRVRCPISMMAQNINNFYQDFNNGGWDTWVQLSQGTNNYYGAYLAALDEKIGAQSAAMQAAQNEAIASAGFLGDKVCDEIRAADGSIIAVNGLTPDQIDTASGAYCTRWRIRTPGKIAAESVVKASGVEIDWLINAKEFSEYLGAIIDALINRIFREGLTALTGQGSAGQTGDYISSRAAPPDTGQNSVTELLQNLRTLRDNLNDYIRQAMLMLEIDSGNPTGSFIDVQRAQTNALNNMEDVLNQGCPIPPAGTNWPFEQIITDGTITNDTCINGVACSCTVTTVDTVTTLSTTINLGSIEQEVTTVYNYDAACVMTATFTAQTTAINPSASTQIDEVTEMLNIAQNRLDIIINQAIPAVQAYQTAAANYDTVNNRFLNGLATQAELDAALNAMNTARDTAVRSVQAATGSTSTDLMVLTSEVLMAATQYTQEIQALQIRGGTVCPAQEGTTRHDICDANTWRDRFATYLTTCSYVPLASPY